MKKILLTFSIFLLCLVAVRSMFSVEAELNVQEAYTYLATTFSDTDDLKANIEGLIDLTKKGGEITFFDGEVGDSFGRNILEVIKGLGDYLVLAYQSFMQGIQLLWSFVSMIFKDLVCVLSILGYLLFGIMI